MPSVFEWMNFQPSLLASRRKSETPVSTCKKECEEQITSWSQYSHRCSKFIKTLPQKLFSWIQRIVVHPNCCSPERWLMPPPLQQEASAKCSPHFFLELSNRTSYQLPDAAWIFNAISDFQNWPGHLPSGPMHNQILPELDLDFMIYKTYMDPRNLLPRLCCVNPSTLGSGIPQLSYLGLKLENDLLRSNNNRTNYKTFMWYFSWKGSQKKTLHTRLILSAKWFSIFNLWKTLPQ